MAVSMISKKIIITGAGRSGTSFLTKVFTRLGYDTGMVPYEESYSDEHRAGCELSINFKETPPEEVPAVIKSPQLAFVLKKLISDYPIGYVLIPMRDLYTSAESRVDTGLLWEQPDEFVNPDIDDIGRQVIINACAIGFAIEACVVTGTPFKIMRFPDFALSEEYCWNCLSSIISGAVPRHTFKDVFRKTSNPKSIKFK